MAPLVFDGICYRYQLSVTLWRHSRCPHQLIFAALRFWPHWSGAAFHLATAVAIGTSLCQPLGRIAGGNGASEFGSGNRAGKDWRSGKGPVDPGDSVK